MYRVQAQVDTDALMFKKFNRANLPKNRIARIVIGVLLILGGLVGFLPVVGFWMVPLGLVVLSIDFAIARRWRRRSEVWWAETWGNRKEIHRRRREQRAQRKKAKELPDSDDNSEGSEP